MPANTTGSKSKTLTYKEGRHYGTIYIEYSVSETVELNSLADQNKAMEGLVAQVHFHHDEHMRKRPQVPSEGDVERFKQPDAHILTERAFELMREDKKGKTFFYVKTPSRAKFGVPMYAEADMHTHIIDRLGDAFSIPLEDVIVKIDTSGSAWKVREVILDGGPV